MTDYRTMCGQLRDNTSTHAQFAAKRLGGLALKLLLLIALALDLSLGPTWGTPAPNPQSKQQVKVWAIPSSKTYHCPKSRWYEKVSGGKYMDECQAIQENYHPAFGVGCGSKCK